MNKSVYYTNYQLDLYSRIIDDQESVNMNIGDNLLSAQLFKPPRFEDYIIEPNGGIIGNLFNPINNFSEIPKKFIEILNMYINGYKEESLSLPGAFPGSNNSKEKNINIKPYESTMVYSNYYKSGLLLFAKYLDDNNIKYTIYEPSLSKNKQREILQDFQDKKITLLLLHSSYYEGFSINGVKIFHILDPIRQYHVKEQLFTRVIRYKSHTHLESDERHVHIIQWYCTMYNIFEKFKQSKSLIQLNASKLNLIFDNIGGIDDKLINNINKKEMFVSELSNTLKSIAIDSNTIKKTCCIYGDKNCSLISCMDL